MKDEDGLSLLTSLRKMYDLCALTYFVGCVIIDIIFCHV